MSESHASSVTLSDAPPMGAKLGSQLSIMMFLQYAIWGAWLPLLWPFLSGHRNFPGNEIGHMFAIGAVGAIIAPFVAGQIADRFFATEKFLGISHIIGGVLIWNLSSLDGYWPFLAFSFAYSVVYSPTLSLTNSLAFHHLPDRDRDFGRVRMWGTIGWIAVGIGIGQWLLHRHTPAEGSAAVIQAAQYAGMADAFKLSGGLGIIMGIFCFVGLPSTPPSKEKKSNASLKALGEIKKNPLLTLFLLAVPISCIHQFYFVHTSTFLGIYQAKAEGFIDLVNKIVGVGGGGLMTIGQMSEFGVLALIPLVAKRLSRKSLLAIGIVAYGLRMFLFAYVEVLPLPEVLTLILGVALHGVCFGCFIFVAFMIVDEETTGDVRASAQSLFNLVIIGIGIIVGSLVAGEVAERATVNGVMNYRTLFSFPMWTAVVCLVILLAFYPGGRQAPKHPD